jgi:hypothetical protein
VETKRRLYKIEIRLVPFEEILSCPQLRLDPKHYIPRHKVEECGGPAEVVTNGKK